MTAVLSGGCFWGMQGVFEHVKGVKQVVAGYAGGNSAMAHYELVSTGTTGHAESVKVTFDPGAGAGHLRSDPAHLASRWRPIRPRLAGSTPTRVRSTARRVWYTSAGPEGRRRARYIAQLDAGHAFRSRITTRVDPLPAFFDAEGYHQDYLVHHPDSPYIATYDLPKVAALKRVFPLSYVPAPVLTVASR